MKSIIKKELKLINENANYYGSKDQIENEKLIYTFAFKDLGIELEYNESILSNTLFISFLLKCVSSVIIIFFMLFVFMFIYIIQLRSC